jgi:hypothetical protein
MTTRQRLRDTQRSRLRARIAADRATLRLALHTAQQTLAVLQDRGRLMCSVGRRPMVLGSIALLCAILGPKRCINIARFLIRGRSGNTHLVHD